MAMDAMGAEEKTVFQKDLGAGVSVRAVTEIRNLNAAQLSPEEMERRRKSSEDGYLIIDYTGPAEFCSILVSKDGVEAPAPIRTYGVKLLNEPQVVATGPDLQGEFKLYDVVLFGGVLSILLQKDRHIWLDWERLGEGLKCAGGGHALIFDLEWTYNLSEVGRQRFLPITRALIMPAKEMSYLVFISESGGCMLWEVKGKKARLEWSNEPIKAPKSAD